MRKIYLLLLVFGVFSCSVDQDEMDYGSDQILEANAIVEIEGCNTMTYDFNEAGFIEVTNDDTNLYITVVANEGFILKKTKLSVVNDPGDFPTNEGGILPPSRLTWKRIFDLGVSSYTFTLKMENFEDDKISIASFSTFKGMAKSYASWAGDKHVKPGKGSWSYLDYEVQTCESFQDPCNYIIGEEYSTSLTFAQVTDGRFPSEVAIRDFYIDLIGEEGINRYGIFDPTIGEIRDTFDDLRGDLSNFPYDLTTIYTIGSGECTDSVVLTLTVTP